MKNRVNDDRFHSCSTTATSTSTTNASIVTEVFAAGNMSQQTAKMPTHDKR